MSVESFQGLIDEMMMMMMLPVLRLWDLMLSGAVIHGSMPMSRRLGQIERHFRICGVTN
ncbi:hypothetical protein BDV34DRAFT_185682 [Aspergillus parasiticus]|uniref:Uncharacterized protein n=1 Tax=Aspergillus parasiticus TaxID=5067 RepID=A0A5N6E4N4_ASPPA|nr:hypothetical protein BDV34DRAFT_185682 [Aspergillus parasiticus]